MESTDEERSTGIVVDSKVDGEKSGKYVESPPPPPAFNKSATPPSAMNNGATDETSPVEDDHREEIRNDSPPATFDLNRESPIGLVGEVATTMKAPSSQQPSQLSPSSGSSSSSTPLSSPFKPHFTILSVKVASQKESLNPSPEFATYLIESKLNNRSGMNGANVNSSNDTSNTDDNSKVYLVKRQWEDIEFLDHCLASSAFPSDGLIIPPLPEKYVPTSDDSIDGSYDHMLKSLSSPSSKYQGSLIKPLWIKDCDEIIEYLNLMLTHPIFGKNYDYWNRFLTADKPAPRISRRKDNTSLMTKISDTFSSGTSASSASIAHSSNISSGNAALAESSVSSQATFSRTYLLSHRDCEDYFQHQKEWVHSYKIYTKNTLDAFNSLIQAKGKLYRVLGHFSTALTLMTTSPNESTQSKKAFKFFNRFSTSLDEYRKSFLLSNYNDEATLGKCLSLWTRYLDSEKQMLLRRTSLLLAYECANRSLDKVKGPKRDEAEQLKLDAERAFEDCSDTARDEIKRFHKIRAQWLACALEKYRETNLALCRDVYNVLDEGIQSLKSCDL